MVGRMQLSNSQKLAERKSCYSGPKENLIEDRRRRRKQPTKNPKEKLHRTKPWERRDQLGGAKPGTNEKKTTSKRQRHRLKSTNQEWRQSHAVPIKIKHDQEESATRSNLD